MYVAVLVQVYASFISKLNRSIFFFSYSMVYYYHLTLYYVTVT